MIKKTITFIDYNGEKRTEDHYFHLSKAELAEMELSENGGFSKLVERIVQERDTKQMIAIFKELIMRSYGIKSLDGRRFEKSEEISRAFTQTEAYTELFLELVGDASAASAFVNGIAPSDLPKTPPSTLPLIKNTENTENTEK